MLFRNTIQSIVSTRGKPVVKHKVDDDECGSHDYGLRLINRRRKRKRAEIAFVNFDDYEYVW